MSNSLIAHIFLIALALIIIISGIYDRLRFRGNFLTKEDKLIIDKVINLLQTPKSEWLEDSNGFLVHPSGEIGFQYWDENAPCIKSGESYELVYNLITSSNKYSALNLIGNAIDKWRELDKEATRQKIIANIRFHQV